VFFGTDLLIASLYQRHFPNDQYLHLFSAYNRPIFCFVLYYHCDIHLSYFSQLKSLKSDHTTHKYFHYNQVLLLSTLFLNIEYGTYPFFDNQPVNNKKKSLSANDI
jgi:hypothetical protein